MTTPRQATPRRQLHVLLLSHVPDDPNGGASRVYHLLRESLQERGHRVDLHHLDAMGMPSNARLRLLAKRTALPSIVSRYGRRLGPSFYDALMASSGSAAPLFARLRRQAHRPLLVNHVHGLTAYDHLAALGESFLGHERSSFLNRAVTGPFQVRWDTAGLRNADITVVQNLRDLSEASSLVGDPARVELIPAAVHPDLLAHGENITPLRERDPGAMLWFGTWEARKGAWYVPQAFRFVRSHRPECTLTVGGTGRGADEIRSFFDPEDRANVRVLPRISLDDQIREFNRAAVFLFPSLSEGFGLALAEAMSFGVAAVTTSTAFGGDHLRDGRTARIVPSTGQHIGRAMLDLVTDDTARVDIATAGRAIARSFTADRQAAAYEHLISARITANKKDASDA